MDACGARINKDSDGDSDAATMQTQQIYEGIWPFIQYIVLLQSVYKCACVVCVCVYFRRVRSLGQAWGLICNNQ